MRKGIPFHVNDPDVMSGFPDGWAGVIYPIKLEEQPYEIDMQIRGWSYHMIFGEQCNGWFVCVPEWSIGAELGDPSDTFWNTGSLLKSGTDDVTTACIVTALKVISSYI